MGKKIECILFSFLILLLGINMIMANDWRNYGNDFFGMWNKQFNGIYGKMDNGNYNISSNIGYTITNPSYTTYQQPLTIETSSNPVVTYIVLANGNYIEIMDSDLNLLSEVNTGNQIYGQIASLNALSYSDSSRDIIAMIKINNSLFNVQGYKFNLTDLSISKIFQSENFTNGDSSENLVGVKTFANNIYFIRLSNSTNGKITKINYTSTVYDNDFNISTVYPLAEIFTVGDFNIDGTTDFLIYGGSGYPYRLKVFSENGNEYLDLFNSVGRYTSPKILKTDLTNQYRVSLISNDLGVNYLQSYKLDGSLIYSKNLGTSSSYYSTTAITDDYNSDNINDIYYAVFDSSNVLQLKILSGSNGNSLFSNSLYSFDSGGDMKLTIADMNNDNKDDFIIEANDNLNVVNGVSGISYLQKNLTGNTRFCIPSDINADGFQDILCSGNSNSQVFFSNTTNTNPTIISVTYDPSLTISTGQPLNMIINANDIDSDSIQYYRSCFNGDSISSVGSGNSQTCLYNSSGTYNATVYVRDYYHIEYNQFSQTITVTESGLICDNDNNCETGETNSNCPNDCPITPSNQSVGGGSGTTSLPLEIVNVEDTSQGLLPTIYYSLMIFLSYVISPVIILVFCIFAVLIFVTIISIIKKLARGV